MLLPIENLISVVQAKVGTDLDFFKCFQHLPFVFFGIATTSKFYVQSLTHFHDKLNKFWYLFLNSTLVQIYFLRYISPVRYNETPSIYVVEYIIYLLYTIYYLLYVYTLYDEVQPKTYPFSTRHLIWVNYKVVSQLFQIMYLACLYINSARPFSYIEFFHEQKF